MWAFHLQQINNNLFLIHCWLFGRDAIFLPNTMPTLIRLYTLTHIHVHWHKLIRKATDQNVSFQIIIVTNLPPQSTSNPIAIVGQVIAVYRAVCWGTYFQLYLHHMTLYESFSQDRSEFWTGSAAMVGSSSDQRAKEHTYKSMLPLQLSTIETAHEMNQFE